jgi:hypothetical protein
MYFEKSGLERIRSQLELSLRRNPNTLIKIFCCGYAMPGWESTMVETVLDMPVHYYEWRRQNRGRGGGGGLGGGFAKNDTGSVAAAAVAGADAAAQDVPLAADSFIDQYNLSSSLPNLNRNSNTNSTNHGRSRGGGMAGWYGQNDNVGTGVMDPFLQKKNSTFRPDPLPGYHPDDLIDYGWDDFSDSKKTDGKNNDDDDKDMTEKELK